MMHFTTMELLFAVCLIVQLSYLLLMYSRLSLRTTKISVDSSNDPVSVLVCARNEAQNLIDLLPRLLSQDYPSYEVVVVNDRSTDNSQEIIEDFMSNHSNLRVVQVKEDYSTILGKKNAVIQGIDAASHEKLVFTDADCVPVSNQWIKGIVNGYSKNTEIVIGASPYSHKTGWLNKMVRSEAAIIAIQYLSFAIAKMPYMAVGRNLSYLKSTFLKNGGFEGHEHIASGDDDLFVNKVANKNNVSVVFDEQTITTSKPVESLNEWWVQKRRHFTTYGRYHLMHKVLLIMFPATYFGSVIFASFLVFQQDLIFFVLIGLMSRYLVQIVIFIHPYRVMRCLDLIWLAPIFELLLMILHPIVLISNECVKPTKWRS